jgi:hypothetical protein
VIFSEILRDELLAIETLSLLPSKLKPGVAAFTVTFVVANAEQPNVVTVYDIVAVPADAPLTTPLLLLTVATDVLDDVHAPPLAVLLSCVVVVVDIVVLPVIALTVGCGFTVIVNELGLPVHKVVLGVTLIVATTGVEPLFVAVNDGTIV